MISYENDCVGPCQQGCLESACRYRKVPYYYCDKCGDETDKIYSGNDEYEHLCKECAEEEMRELIKHSDFDELCKFFEYEEVT